MKRFLLSGLLTLLTITLIACSAPTDSPGPHLPPAEESVPTPPSETEPEAPTTDDPGDPEEPGIPTATVPVDVLFLIDTSSDSVLEFGLPSVLGGFVEFFDTLTEKKRQPAVGVMTFGGAFDTRSEATPNTVGVSISGLTPPIAFDAKERPTILFSSDVTAVAEFLTQQQGFPSSPGWGHEEVNAVGALQYALDVTGLGWREEAEKHVVVLTSSCSHTGDTYHFGGITGPWIPGTFADTRAAVGAAGVTVHVIQPGDLDCRQQEAMMSDLAGSGATGGVFAPWPRDDATQELIGFDFRGMPVVAAIAGE